jgi:DNA-binding transcriptional MerR regulator
MFSIGDFARHGRVSVRMLRHYDAIGLLRPATVDQATGYRFYEAGQLARLNRIVALKDLGFTLQQVRSILDDKVSVEELRGMLRLRQAELQAQISADSARLAQVEARLQVIEREGAMPADDVQVKRLPAVRLAELTAVAAGFEPESIAPVITPLYDELIASSGPG